ncbi:heme-degrading domain-containing protein [Phytobacter sp. V91]|uniref:heme-degrading domain-containing protein n=1 Tax=Phytobacter sp. V91 TaxID=3369425 RepID=UPI003F5F1380
MSLDQQIALCEQHREQLRFVSFDADDAWALGNALYRNAERKGFALAIEVNVNHLCMFSALMPGATAENIDWVRRKRNMVAFLGISSWAAGLMLQSRQTTLALRYGLSLRDYAAFGGSYPLYLTSGCQIGSVTVSGAPQRDDHNLVLETLREMLGIAPGAFTLVTDVV